MSTWFYIAFLATLAGTAWLSLRARRGVKTTLDYALAGRGLGARGVSSVITATLVGGASTVGTVQLAYSDGLVAWIFTLGSGLACLVLALVFARPLREEGVVTVAEYLGRFFGPGVQTWSSAFTSIGMFIHVAAQFLAAMAILRGTLPLSAAGAFAATAALIFGFVVVGGLASSGVVGRIKFVLLYATLVLAAVIALWHAGGVGPLLARAPGGGYFNLFSKGAMKGTGDILAMIVGVVSTQTYLQAIFAARDVRAARRGALIGAAAIPPLGLLGVLVGLFLREAHPELATRSAEALPFFLTHYLPAPLAGFFMAGLLVIVLGTAAGLVLGVTTNLHVDVVERVWGAAPGARGVLRMRLAGALVLLLATGLVAAAPRAAILDWSYVSMGLRGAAVFAGLVIVLAWRDRGAVRRWAWLVYAVPVLYLAWSFA